MADRSKIHVTPRGDDWAIKREHSQRAIKVVEDKQDAIDRAREIAKEDKPSQVIIHGQDGKIQSERTYGNDPFPPRG